MSATFQVPEVLAKELARFLEDQIVFNEIAPGTRLVEEDLVRRHDISRSPVREALRILEQDGLIVRDQRRGVRVGAISLVDLDEVYACRIALESLAAEAAAQHRTEADLVALDAALAALDAAYAGAELRAYFQQNVRLSTQIYVASGNATLRRLLGSIGKQALRYRFLAYSRTPALMQRSVEGNRGIVDAIRGSQARTARTLTADLIHQSWQAIRQTIVAD